jgi:hypothetical protein
VSNQTNPQTSASEIPENNIENLPTYECGVCFMEIEATDELKVLACGHAFHDECIIGAFQVKINERQVEGSKLVCPTGGEQCQQIDTQMLSKILPDDVLDNYFKYLGQNLQFQLNPNEVKFNCPGTDCNNFYILLQPLDQFY